MKTSEAERVIVEMLGRIDEEVLIVPDALLAAYQAGYAAGRLAQANDEKAVKKAIGNYREK